MERDRDVWTAWPVSWSAIWVGALGAIAAVVAVATVVYVVFTLRLWEATEKTARAAGKSADAAAEAALAAKKSADLAAAIHRPFMGLVRVTLKTGWGTDLWVIALAMACLVDSAPCLPSRM